MQHSKESCHLFNRQQNKRTKYHRLLVGLAPVVPENHGTLEWLWKMQDALERV